MTPLVNLAASRYEVKLEVPSADGMTDIYLRFTSVSISKLLKKGLTFEKV